MDQFGLHDWIASRLSGGRALLNAPAIGALLPDIPGGEPNLLPVSALGTALRVDIETWPSSAPGPGEPERLELFWDGHLLDSKSWESAIDPRELFFMVPAERLGEGTHPLYYRVHTPNGEIKASAIITLTVDRTPPLLLNDGPLLFAAEIIRDGVTHAWLSAHGDRLPAVVPDYQTVRPGDVITWYWSATLDGFEPAGSRTLALGDIGRPLEILYLGELIRARGDGQRYASYKVCDRAGNCSPHALPTALTVRASRPPRELPAPALKGTTSTALDPLDGIGGVSLVVPASAVLYDDDRVFMQWAEPGSPGAWRSDEPVAPREYRVPASQVPQQLGRLVPVYYEVLDYEGDVHESRRLQLQVHGLKGLPALQCDAINGGQISLADLQARGGYADCSIGSWSFMSTAQLVTLRVKGIGSDNQPLEVRILDAQPVPWLSNPLPLGRIGTDDLARFRTDSPLTLEAEVSFDEQRSWTSFQPARARLVA